MLAIFLWSMVPRIEVWRLVAMWDIVLRTDEAESAMKPLGSMSVTFVRFCGLTEILRSRTFTLTEKDVGIIAILHCVLFKFRLKDPAVRAVEAFESTGRVLF